MLESMTTAPRPTRAEISDVANAVYDGTSAVRLSAESAAGKYPVESVKALDAICTEAENNGEFTALHEYIDTHSIKDKNAIRGSICKAAKEIAAEVGAKAIIVESATGRVARAMVHFRPEVPVIAVVTSQLVCRKLCLNWGVNRRGKTYLGRNNKAGYGKGVKHRTCPHGRYCCCTFVKQNLPDLKHRLT